MAQFPTKEADDQRVYRIAKELGIGLEDAAVTCAGFELAFSDDSLRREIFGIIDQLDDEAAKKGEPLGLILSYAVELGQDGIRVGRYADEIPAGEIVNLTPTDRAMIFLKIKDNFPTQQFLGPLIVNRPVFEFESEERCPAEQDGLIMKLPSLAKEGWQPPWADGVVRSDESQIPDPKSQIEWRGGLSPEINKLPSLDKEGWQPPWADGVVRSDTGITEPEIPTDLPAEPTEPFIWGIPPRLTLDQRFPFLSAAASRSQHGFLLSSAAGTAFARPLLASVAFHSGLSPPPVVGECGHSASKDVPPALAIDVRDTGLTF